MEILEIKESTAVQAHITMLQGIIKRMATNSANCKTWSITILAAMLVLVVEDKICSEKMWICYIPIGLFFFLDCFYLGLERSFIKKQNSFISKINKEEDIERDLFVLETETDKGCWRKIASKLLHFWQQLFNTLVAIISFSTLPFYAILTGIVYFISK